jgi:hypothetical protein
MVNAAISRPALAAPISSRYPILGRESQYRLYFAQATPGTEMTRSTGVQAAAGASILSCIESQPSPLLNTRSLMLTDPPSRLSLAMHPGSLVTPLLISECVLALAGPCT